MAKLERVLSALMDGKDVRREAWDEGTRLFLTKDEQLMQQASNEPYLYTLDGMEVMADDWLICGSSAA